MNMLFMILFGIFLYIVGAALMAVELFVPSLGLLTICSIACLIGGGAVFFQFGPGIGWIGVGLGFVVVPIVWFIVYKLFPHTAMGRAIMIGRPNRSKGDGIPDGPQLVALMNRRGVTLSQHRPVGICDFDGRRVECVAESGIIVKGKPVRVVHVEGMRVTVREMDESTEHLK